MEVIRVYGLVSHFQCVISCIRGRQIDDSRIECEIHTRLAYDTIWNCPVKKYKTIMMCRVYYNVGYIRIPFCCIRTDRNYIKPRLMQLNGDGKLALR